MANESGDGNGTANMGSSAGTLFTGPVPGGADKTVATILGEIVWLMSQSPTHKQMFISDLEWLVMPPVLLQQYRLFYGPDRPIGALFWGFVDDACEDRLKSGGGNARLRAQDWKAGENLWIVDILAPFGGADEMIKDLKLQVFPNQEIRMLSLVGGQLSVKAV
jgi:cytolysin-activating lysine-acyltransferase